MDTQEKPVYCDSVMNLQARRLREKDLRELGQKFGDELGRAWRSRRPLRANEIAKLIPAKVVAELNATPQSGSSKRVARFLELYTKAKDLNDSFRLFFQSREEMLEFLYESPALAHFHTKQPHFCTGWSFTVPEIQGLNKELNRVLLALNSLLRRYRWFPVVRHMGFETPRFDVTEDWPSRSQGWEDWETYAIWWLCNSRNECWIDWFRRCADCNKWFFASAVHQTYCRNACRKRTAARSDHFKDRRKLYMRDYRRQEKERDLRARTNAKREVKEG